jgi:5-methylcytosine-specific restriction protein A
MGDNILNRSTAFRLLGTVPTNPRWSWCAKSSDCDRVVFTLWEDQIINGQNQLSWPDDEEKVSKRNGFRDQKRILDLAISQKIPAYGLICTAKDASATVRTIQKINHRELVKLELIRNGDYYFAVHRERIPFKYLVRSSQKKLQNTGVNDLNFESGFDGPVDRAYQTTFAFKRNPKVRKQVLLRANGCCEFCGEKGFPQSNDTFYVETHHIIALANEGADSLLNVIALCPNHHREAHFGTRALELENDFIRIVAKRQMESQSSKKAN